MSWSKIQEHLEQWASSGVPTWVFAVTGVCVLFAAFKTGKMMVKVLLVLAALVSIGGAVLWHYHKR